MQRINVTAQGDHGTKLVGWFDRSTAESWGEDTRWDGSNHVSIATGSQWDHEQLYQTAGGRFVLYRWSQWQGREDVYEFVGIDAAREWLMLNGHDDVIERLFGAPPEPERGPGRPEIGKAIDVRLPTEQLAYITAWAKEADISRAEVLRIIVANQMLQRD